MVEQDAVTCKEIEAFPVVFNHSVGVNLGGGVRGSGVKGSVFVLRRRGGAEHFAA